MGSWLFVKMYNFLQVMVILKNAVCSNGICWNEKKKVPIFRRGLSRKKMSYVSAMVVVDLIGGGSCEKLSPDYIPVKPR